MIQAGRLRTEAIRDPLGLHATHPRLSWIAEDPRRDARQSAWEIVAADTADALPRDDDSPDAADGVWMWASGCVDGDQVQTRWGGVTLGSRQRVWWTIRLWDANGRVGPWARPATFELGLLHPRDWHAEWIAAPGHLRTPTQRPSQIADLWPVWTTPDGVTAEQMICRRPVRARTGFACQDVVDARLYIAIRGLAAVSLNGARVGNEELAPCWVDHRTRLLYRVHDVTSLVSDGANAIGVTLADGWWSGRVFWRGETYGTDPSVMVQLELTHADGSTSMVTSDATWETAAAPELWADLMMGEVRDLTLDEPGWDQLRLTSDPQTAAEADRQWHPAITLAAPEQRLVCHPNLRVRVALELAPISITKHGVPATTIVDLGQNMVGRVRLRLRRGPSSSPHTRRLNPHGDGREVVVVRHGEMLEPDGSLYTTNLRTAAAIDAYLLDDSDEVVLEPRFTSHGFRYVEISGLPDDAELVEVTGVVLSSDVDEVAGFACSNPMLEQLFSNICWSRRGNTVGLMTDCPQRDERLGWMGDALVFLPTAVWLADLQSLVTTWYDDVLDGRSDRGVFQDIAPVVPGAPYLGSSSGWADAGVAAPWTLYDAYGDTDILATSIDAMLDWVHLVAADNPDGLWLTARSNDYGDWLAVEADTPKELLATARHAQTLAMVADVADVLGRTTDAAWCRARREVVVAAFCDAYLTPSGRLVGHTQTAYVLALAFDLLPDDLRDAAAGFLRGRILDDRGFDATFAPGHLTTGILGTVHLLDVLTTTGQLGLAYQLIEADTYPSWGFPIQNGATTLWERWDGWTPDRGFQTPEMNSFNHTSLGAVGTWLFTTVAGITSTSPGFATVRVAPQPGGSLTWAEAHHDGPRGRIAVRWERADQILKVRVTIPCSTTAEVILPGNDPISVGAGTHTFASPI